MVDDRTAAKKEVTLVWSPARIVAFGIGLAILAVGLYLLYKLGGNSRAIAAGLVVVVGIMWVVGSVVAAANCGALSNTERMGAWSGWRDVVALSMLGVIAVAMLHLLGVAGLRMIGLWSEWSGLAPVAGMQPGSGGGLSAPMTAQLLLTGILGALLGGVVWAIVCMCRRE